MTQVSGDLYQPAIARGRGKALQRMNGIARSEVTEILADFSRCPPDGQAAFAHTWVSKIAVRLEETWPLFYQMLKVIDDQQVYKNAHVIGNPHAGPKSYTTFREYFEAEVKEPFEKWAELEQTYHFVTTYAPHLFGKQYSEAHASVAAQLARDEEVKKINRNGGDRKTEQGISVLHRNTEQQGNSREYLVRRLKRDAPEIAAALGRGEYRSARAAGIAAGFIRAATPLETLKRLWRKAAPHERDTFLRWVQE